MRYLESVESGDQPSRSRMVLANGKKIPAGEPGRKRLSTHAETGRGWPTRRRSRTGKINILVGKVEIVAFTLATGGSAVPVVCGTRPRLTGSVVGPLVRTAMREGARSSPFDSSRALELITVREARSRAFRPFYGARGRAGFLPPFSACRLRLRHGLSPSSCVRLRGILAGNEGIEPHTARVWSPACALRYHPHGCGLPGSTRPGWLWREPSRMRESAVFPAVRAASRRCHWWLRCNVVG